MVLVSTVAEAAIAPAMISPCTSRLCDARVDQAGAELRQIENAATSATRPARLSEDDAAGQAGEATARTKNCPARRSQSSRRCAAVRGGARDGAVVRSDAAAKLSSAFRHLDQAAFDRAMADTAGLFAMAVLAMRSCLARFYADAAAASVDNSRADGRADQVSLKR